MLNHPDLNPNVQEDEASKRDGLEIDLVLKNSDNADNEIEVVEHVQPLVDFQSPSFTYNLGGHRSRRHILVLDVSQSMNMDRKWEMTRNAVFRLINDIPEGDEVGIVSFGANARLNIEPTEVTASNRAGLYGRVPFRVLNGQQGCLECGLKMALTAIDSATTGSIILVTSTTSGYPSSTLSEGSAIVDKLALPVYTVAFDSLDREVLALSKYGATYAIQDDISIVKSLSNVFVDILNKIGGNGVNGKIVKSYEKSFDLEKKMKEAGAEAVVTSNGKRGIGISGNFIVEEDLRTDLWVVLTSPYKEDVEIFEVTSPSGQRKVFPHFEHGIVYFKLTGTSEAGIWSYKATLYPVTVASTQGQIKATVEVFARETESSSVQVNGWTNVDKLTGASALDEAVVIYAKVTKGQNVPIINADVVASVTRPDSSVAFEVVLTDNGSGYPDITAGDGIYSGYFTGFSTEAGLYSLQIKATHNNGIASTPTVLSTAKNLSCCGSVYVPADKMYTTPTAPFYRYVTADSFQVTKGMQYFVVNGQPEMDDVFPPSRVTDFSVASYVNGTLYATLKWSAPGGDFTDGYADSYEIRCYTNAEALDDRNFASMGIPVHESLLPTPGNYGTEQSATVGLPWANEIFYYGLVAIDAAGNRSPVSNLVPVFAAETASTVNGNENEVIIEDNRGNAFSSAVREAFGDNDVLIYIVAGVISGLVLIITLIILITVCRAKQRKAAEKRSQNARTQIFVNDLENPNTSASILPDLAPEKPQNYSDIWTTAGSANGPTVLPATTVTLPPHYTHQNPHHSNSSPTNSSLEEYANMMYSQQQNPQFSSGTGSASLHYPPQYQMYYTNPPSSSTVPVHEYKVDGTDSGINGTPTYQNWNLNGKPPSDNGTATTSSTECYEDQNSDNSTKLGKIPVQRRYSCDDYIRGGGPENLSLSPSFCSSSEKRRRQESLV